MQRPLLTPSGPRFSVRNSESPEQQRASKKFLILEELHLFVLYIVSRTNCSAVFAYKERQNFIYKQDKS